MSRYEDLKVSEDNNFKSDYKPYNLNASDWSVDDAEMGKNDPIQETKELSDKQKMSKKHLVVFCVIAGIMHNSEKYVNINSLCASVLTVRRS